MRHFPAKLAALVSVLMLALTLAQPAHGAGAGTGPSRAAAAETAYFEFDYPPMRERFVFQLTDAAKIQEARDILSGKEKEKIHVMGRVIKRSVPYNPGWSFHLDPGSVQFFEVAIEVCDSSIQYVEDHLDEAGGAFLPGGWWCPWGSRLLREVPVS
ncbi:MULTISPECIES: calmodulin-binding protein [unclassified Streptomyces]|uniref:BP74-related protein n=1 Tax=unclassified Streptomyces TaxID=2593676 RepID=UPI0033A9FB68